MGEGGRSVGERVSGVGEWERGRKESGALKGRVGIIRRKLKEKVAFTETTQNRGLRPLGSRHEKGGRRVGKSRRGVVCVRSTCKSWYHGRPAVSPPPIIPIIDSVVIPTVISCHMSV